MSKYEPCYHCQGWVNTQEHHVLVERTDGKYYFHYDSCIQDTSLRFNNWQVNHVNRRYNRTE